MIRKISVFFVHLACIIYFNLKIVGKENVPKEGAYILCATISQIGIHHLWYLL